MVLLKSIFMMITKLSIPFIKVKTSWKNTLNSFPKVLKGNYQDKVNQDIKDHQNWDHLNLIVDQNGKERVNTQIQIQIPKYKSPITQIQMQKPKYESANTQKIQGDAQGSEWKAE